MANETPERILANIVAVCSWDLVDKLAREDLGHTVELIEAEMVKLRTACAALYAEQYAEDLEQIKERSRVTNEKEDQRL